MKLKTTEYKTIEVAEDEEYGMVIGNIVMDGSKMLGAEIVNGTIYNHTELKNIRAFLYEVENRMTPEVSRIVVATTAGDAAMTVGVDMDIRCE